jgi:Flp pilus assembly protein TadD
MPKAIRLAPSLVALLLGCSALSSAAHAGWFSSAPKPAAPKADDNAPAQPASTLDDSIHQAQMLRLAGNYKEALNHLSQLMLIAADDGRVISEYGKTLVSMGRTEEAQKFLTRAQQLEPGDWSVYSALGVAYDQLGNQQEAKINYERALELKPGEPSVLSNYALSRMLAKDPAGARKLADRAETANAGAPDAKITRDIAMIRSMAPQTDDFAATTPPPAQAPVAAPHMAVAAAPLPAPVVTRPMPAPMATPRLAAAIPAIHTQPEMAPALNQAPRGVVMEPVPVDPLAGPVDSKGATHAPRSLQPRALADSEASIKPEAKPDAPKPTAEAIAKTSNKPGAIAQAKPEAARDRSTRLAARVSVPVKAADVKSDTTRQAAPRVLLPQDVKEASAKPANKLPKPASKDAIPDLRLSANAY